VNYELSVGCTAIADYLVELGGRTGSRTDRRGQILAGFDAIAQQEEQLADRLLSFLRSRNSVRIIGDPSADRTRRVPTISFIAENHRSDEVVTRVDEHRIGIRGEEGLADELAGLADEVGTKRRDAHLDLALRHRGEADGFKGVDRNDPDDTIADTPRGLERDIATHRVADEHDLTVRELPHDGGDILAVVAHRPIGAILPGSAVSREVHRHHGVFRFQRIDLRLPIVRIACPAVHEHDGRLAGSIDAILDVHVVGGHGDLWIAVDVGGRGRRRRVING